MSTRPTVAGVTPLATAPQPGLSEISRVVNAFVAPTATFTDIRRNASWWLPWLFMAIVQLAFAFAIDQRFGWDTVTEQQTAKNPAVQARLEAVDPGQREQILRRQSQIAKYLAYAAPARILLMWAIISAIFLAIFNIGFGAEIPFKQSLSTWAYGTMPLLISYVLTIVSIYTAGTPEDFNLSQPVASNLAYFVDPKGARLLYWLASCADLLDIWAIVLLGIGYSIVSGNRVKRGTAIAIFAVLFVLLKGLGALFV